MMFGKKRRKTSGEPIMHYEGIPGFEVDYPCFMEFDKENLIIKRIEPETTVTLALSRIRDVSWMDEDRFMLKYHGNKAQTSKSKAWKKHYWIITYDEGYIAVWTASNKIDMIFELREVIDAPKNITL